MTRRNGPFAPLTALILCIALILALTACGAPSGGDGGTDPDAPEEPGETEISMWIYPVGGWGTGSSVSSIVSAFHREYPNIRLTVKMLDYTDGDSQVEDAIVSGQAPDLIFEGPERLSANWGARGLMADLSDLWQSPEAGEIYDSVTSACVGADGRSFIFPLCMTTHCMAVNRDLMEAAGTWQYIDEESHTWTTDGFVAAVKALRDYGVENVGTVYCGGQGGDQGTRALVTNLYSGSFTDPGHTEYTFASPENIRALELLRDLDGITFDATAVGSDVIEDFCAGNAAMCFCWNVASEVTQTISSPTLDFDIYPVAFPTDDGQFNLQGGIWGFGIFDNGDAGRVEAAKTFIRFITGDLNRYTQAVLASTFWPVRDVPNIYENDSLMTEYFTLRQYMGDYYQVTPGWAEARTAWWTMLRSVASGTPAADAAGEFQRVANEAAKKQ